MRGCFGFVAALNLAAPGRARRVGAERNLKVETSPVFSFLTVGLLFPYHIGVAQFLIQNSYIKNLDHTKRTHEAVDEKGTKHIFAAMSLIRNASYSNAQHDIEINSTRVIAEEDVAKNNEDLLEQFDEILYIVDRNRRSEAVKLIEESTNKLSTNLGW